ncbi:MAG: response regulator [Anaerolineaceae bacterium]|nr:response regulator [Anaerolineaceae bacterium]
MASLTKRRIFVVEDDINNRIITHTALMMQDVRIEFDRWGRDTMGKLSNFGKPDIILLDLMFPNGITGYDIFDKIRADPRYDNVPIVAVSASDAATSIPRCKEKGFNGFIAKPIDTDHFSKQLEEILDGQSIWQGF